MCWRRMASEVKPHLAELLAYERPEIRRGDELAIDLLSVAPDDFGESQGERALDVGDHDAGEAIFKACSEEMADLT